MRGSATRYRPEYLRLLAGILLLYALIILFGTTTAADPARIALLAFLLWTATRLRANNLRWWALGLGIAAVVLLVLISAFAPASVAYAATGGSSLLFIGAVIAAIVSALLARRRMDGGTVLGVLCVYLLLALLFASLHQVFAYEPGYLNGTQSPPTPSDLLYFSAITLATVGFGDITPASEVARTVTVTEALTGQLYLVSVVAAVVGRWQATPR